MNAMTCQDVQEQLDLLAAGECDQPTRQEVKRHLENCAVCAASYAESRRLLGLLEINWNESGPARLRERIEQEERRTRRRQFLSPFVRRAAALAALVLLTIGLFWMLPKRQPDANESDLQLTLLVRDDGPEVPRDLATGARTAHDPAARMQGSRPEMVVTPVVGQIGEAFRRDLHQAQRDGKLPPPTPLPVALALKNSGERSQEVQLGGAESELSLELSGEGVVRIPAGGVAEPEFLQSRALQLAAGEQFVFRIDRLIAGTLGAPEYIYLTEPGEYTLTARLRLSVGGKVVTLQSETIRIKVKN